MVKTQNRTRAQVAVLLNVTPARVSQIAKELKIVMQGTTRDGFSYRPSDVLKMLKRNTRPGPKRNGGKR